MRQFLAINRRNLKIYIRDTGAIFYSFLSMIIIIILMLFFLGDVNSDGILEMIKMIPGRGGAEDVEFAKKLIYVWTTAGIITINASTVTLAFLANMIKDRNQNRLNSILVMPTNRTTIVLGYIFGAFTASVFMCTMTLLITELLGLVKGIGFFSFDVHVKLLLLILVNSFISASVMFLFAAMIKTEGAWSGFGIVVGTVVGFLGGIYFPAGSLSSGVLKAIKCFPIIYGSSAFRKVMMNDLETEFFKGTPDIMRKEFDFTMGIDLTLFKKDLSIGTEVCILMAIGIIFALLGILYVQYGKRKDR